MELTVSLKIVLELAEQNVIDEDIARIDETLKNEREKQLLAVASVENLYKFLKYFDLEYERKNVKRLENNV